MNWFLRLILAALGIVSLVGGHIEQQIADEYAVSSQMVTAGAMMATGDQAAMQSVAMVLYVLGAVLLLAAICWPRRQKTYSEAISRLR